MTTPSGAAEGIASIAVIVASDAPADMGSPDMGSAGAAAGRLTLPPTGTRSVDTMTKPSDAAEGTAVIAVSVVGEMPCIHMGSPSCRAEESPVHSAADENAEREALICW